MHLDIQEESPACDVLFSDVQFKCIERAEFCLDVEAERHACGDQNSDVDASSNASAASCFDVEEQISERFSLLFDVAAFSGTHDLASWDRNIK